MYVSAQCHHQSFIVALVRLAILAQVWRFKLHILTVSVYPPWPLPGRAVLTSLGVVLQSSLFLGVVGASSPVHSLLWKSLTTSGQSGVPHHGVAVRIQGICLTCESFEGRLQFHEERGDQQHLSKAEGPQFTVEALVTVGE